MAKGEHKTVEVTSLTDEHRRVTVDPGGTFTDTLSAVPARVRRGAGWVDPDPTLALSDGHLRPRAAAADVSLGSGGGELATVADHGRAFSLSWPERLPSPIVRGDRAVYADIRPGIDLVVQASPVGFAQYLVVHSPQAAQDPLLEAYRLGFRAPGLTVSRSGTTLQAVDESGRVVFDTDSIQMWASTGTVPTSPLEATLYVTGDMAPGATADVDFSVGGSEVVMRPDAALLADPATHYPVVIDPVVRAATYNYEMIDSVGHEYHTLTDTKHVPQAGFEKVAGLKYGGVVTRLFYGFTLPADVRAGGSRRVRSASLRLSQTNAPHRDDCGEIRDEAHPTYLWRVHDFKKDLKWDHQPGTISLVGKNSVVNPDAKKCKKPARVQEWDATTAVKEHLDGGDDRLSFRVNSWHDNDTEKSPESRDEGSRVYEHNGAYPQLEITYNNPPDAPSAVSVSSSAGCAADATYVSSTPTLCAALSDPDAGDSLTPTFWVAPKSGAGAPVQFKAAPVHATSAARTTATYTLRTAERLADGATYRVYATAVDGSGLTSPSGPSRTFTVDADPPRQAPPVSGLSVSNGVLTFTLDAPEPDVTSYLYGVDATTLTRTAAAGASGGAVTISSSGLTTGLHLLYVQSRDRAGNLSPISAPYAFRI